MTEFDKRLLYSQYSCMPCQEGEHDGCRKHPDKDGSWWYDEYDEEGNKILDERGRPKTRLYLKDKKTGKEIPRPLCVCMKMGHPVGDLCRVRKRSEGYGGGVICAKPAKGDITVRGSFTYADVDAGDFTRLDVTIPACGTHMAAKKRRDDNDAKRAAELDERDKQRAREKSAAQASEDWAQKLADEFGLPTTPLKRNSEKILVEMSPEVAYKKLSEIRQMLDEVYGSDHPWSRDDGH